MFEHNLILRVNTTSMAPRHTRTKVYVSSYPDQVIINMYLRNKSCSVEVYGVIYLNGLKLSDVIIQ